MSKRFKKGDKVWVRRVAIWEKGKVLEDVLDDGTYLVKTCGYLTENFVCRRMPDELERRTGLWR